MPGSRKEALTPLAQLTKATELTKEILLKTADVIYWMDGYVELQLKADVFLGERE